MKRGGFDSQVVRDVLAAHFFQVKNQDRTVTWRKLGQGGLHRRLNCGSGCFTPTPGFKKITQQFSKRALAAEMIVAAINCDSAKATRQRSRTAIFFRSARLAARHPEIRPRDQATMRSIDQPGGPSCPHVVVSTHSWRSHHQRPVVASTEDHRNVQSPATKDSNSLNPRMLELIWPKLVTTVVDLRKFRHAAPVRHYESFQLEAEYLLDTRRSNLPYIRRKENQNLANRVTLDQEVHEMS